MSKLSHGDGLVVPSTTQEYLVGSILEIIEALGLQERQEASTKRLVKKAIYNQFENAIHILDNLHDALWEVRDNIADNARRKNEPTRGIGLIELR